MPELPGNVEQEGLDAVWIETTTHARVLAALHAMQAGVDVYAEKPISLTIHEGRTLVTAARKLNRVLQAGSQQRSIPINRYASELVRSGKIGKIQSVVVCNYLPPMDWTPLPGEPVPEGMDWDRWCNQTELRPYHTLLHRRWHKWWDYDDGGESWGVSGWGTHGLDQVQCALGTDDTGPVEIWTENKRDTRDEPDFPLLKDEDAKPALGRKPVIMRCASSVLLKLENPERTASPNSAALLLERTGRSRSCVGTTSPIRPNCARCSPSLRWAWAGCLSPQRTFWNACVRGERPNADVEIEHRATSLCHMVSIARKLDPQATLGSESRALHRRPGATGCYRVRETKATACRGINAKHL